MYEQGKLPFPHVKIKVLVNTIKRFLIDCYRLNLKVDPETPRCVPYYGSLQVTHSPGTIFWQVKTLYPPTQLGLRPLICQNLKLILHNVNALNYFVLRHIINQ